MISLRNFAAHRMPKGTVLPEVVAKDILQQSRNEICKINTKIGNIEGKYQKMFNRYTKILDPRDDVGGQYAKSRGEEFLFDVMYDLKYEYNEIYKNIPIDYDENSEWFAYLEFMHFRAFPPNSLWVHHGTNTHNESILLFAMVKGILGIIRDADVPSGPVPTELAGMNTILSIYTDHLTNLDEIYQKRYSPSVVFETQKKYVAIYEERSSIKYILGQAKNFYNTIKSNMCSSIYIPHVLL